MKRLNPIFQIFFKLLLIFLITFVWMRYFVKSLIYAVLISAVLTAVIDFLTRYIGNKRQSKINLKRKEISDAEDMFLSLATQDNAMSFFKSIISQKHKITSKKKYFIYGDDILFYPFFTLSKVEPNDIAVVMKNIKNEEVKKIVIVAGDFSNECQNFINLYDKKIILLNQYETYQKIYKAYDAYPNVSLKKVNTKKTTIKDLLAYSFNRSRTKGYIFSAIIIFFCSLFVKASLYYAIITSILILFAIISFTNQFYNKKLPEEEF